MESALTLENESDTVSFGSYSQTLTISGCLIRDNAWLSLDFAALYTPPRGLGLAVQYLWNP